MDAALQGVASRMTHLFTPLQALLITAPTILLGAYYLRRSMRLGTFAMLVFLVSIAYGLSVELLDIRTTETYFYTDLQLMLGRDPNWVPFSVGVSWAAILFIAMTTSDRLGLPTAWRPAFDGTLALSLDFVMDPVASASVWVPQTGPSCATVTTPPFGGLGMWTWCVPEGATALWYSVPFSNFTGWFLVVGCMSAAVRIARGPLDAERRPWPAQLAILFVVAAGAALTVLCTAWIYPRVLQSHAAQSAVLWTLFLTPIVTVIVLRKRLAFDHPLDKGLLALPALILVSETGTFFVRGIDRARWPGSAVLLVLFAVLSATLLLLPYLRRPARAA
jgi:hypothetical protein